MTPAVLAVCTGARADRAAKYAAALTSAMLEFRISTPPHQALFLAHVGHESGGLRWLTELWGPTPAQARYEGRKDLGNTQPGDGFRFRGRGFIQTTGRANYERAGRALNLDLIGRPEQLSEPDPAARSAAYFFVSNGLGSYADRGDLKGSTKVVNGGFNGLHEREQLWLAGSALPAEAFA